MDAVHSTFNVLKKIESRINKKIIFISEQTPDRSKYYNWISINILKQICFQKLKALDMSNALKSKNFDLVFIFEHKPWYSYLLYYNCIRAGKPVYFIVHGIQQTYNNSFFHRIGFKLLMYLERRYKFYPVHLELSDRDAPGVKCFSKSIVISHPLPKTITLLPKNKDKIRIGILGIIRDDKPIMPLINILKDYDFDEVEIVIGTSQYSIPDDLTNLPFQVIDTSTIESYNEFIGSLHIVVNNFDREQFYFRPSGIINDSIAGGCFVIAPNYPVFKAQITTPVVVGELFNHLEEIPDIIKKAIKIIKETDIDFKRWIEHRSDAKVVEDLSNKILAAFEKTVIY